MKKLLSLGFMLLIATAPRALAGCVDVPGAAQLWSNTSVRWVWVGEVHGTTETPAAFGDLVCDALAHGRQVTVALERPDTEQAAIDALVGSGDLGAARQRLLSQIDWRGIFDGRTSQAMLHLLLRLRELKAEYPALRVVAIVNTSDALTSVPSHDEAMGHAVLSLQGGKPEDIVLVLTGNVHGLKNPIFGYKTAAMYLPAGELVSLQVTDGGGEAWTMGSHGCGVGSETMPDSDKKRAFGVTLDPKLALAGTVDGILALGRPVTASLPANPDSLATAPCRKQFLALRAKQHR
ncbi:MAG: hypothetical protein WBY53_05840 [Acidobacteriaceae bacterium]